MGKKPQGRARRAFSEDEEAVEQVGVQADELAARSRSAAVAALDDAGFVKFALAGTRVSGDFRCADCGYGAVVHRALPLCPMCGGTIWESLGPAMPNVRD